MTLDLTDPAHGTFPEVLKAKNMRYHSWHVAALGEGQYCLYNERRDLHTIGTAEEVFAQFPLIPSAPTPRKPVVRNEYVLPPIDLASLEIDIDLDF